MTIKRIYANYQRKTGAVAYPEFVALVLAEVEAKQATEPAHNWCADVYDSFMGTLTRYPTATMAANLGCPTEFSVVGTDTFCDAGHSELYSDGVERALLPEDFLSLDELVLMDYLGSVTTNCPSWQSVAAYVWGVGTKVRSGIPHDAIYRRLWQACVLVNGLFYSKPLTLAEREELLPHLISLAMYLSQPSNLTKAKDNLTYIKYQTAMEALKNYLTRQDNLWIGTPAVDAPAPAYIKAERSTWGTANVDADGMLVRGGVIESPI